ncbi:hypothetical protein LSH36_58g19044 [Paralvinella palmiformis]|uniref:Myotubularin phosphatase domain-containing protein n=1 Tax=Paralvinella palmiformis TaxID=53620 RepID=A0AAD9K6G2_9ANNE|nr:hypothetical protein LSH36_58g19044 [Paralvinella palmiformis]
MSRMRQRLSRKVTTSKPSFVSYVNDTAKPKETSEDEQSLDLDLDELSKPSSAVTIVGITCSSYAPETIYKFDDICLRRLYTKVGEVIVSRADRVVRYVPYSDFHQGLVGSIFVTEFRILFLSIQDYDAAKMNPFWKNKIYGENDIILNNIQGVYHVTKGKRKKLITGKQGSRLIKKIEIQCKDFHLCQFGFENIQPQEASRIINAITHFAFTDKLERLFAFAYKGDIKPDNNSSPLPDFSTKGSWEAELRRLSASKLFKVVDSNDSFKESRLRNSSSLMSFSLPLYFVVPSVVTSDSLRKDLMIFEDYRVPVWSYTYKNGASLIRMTFPIDSYPEKDFVDQEFEQRLKQIHPEKRKPVIVDVHEIIVVFDPYAVEEYVKLPSLKELKQSHNKLRELCMPVTMKILESTDQSWYSSLESSKWLTYVTSFLKVALHMARIMIGDLPPKKKQFRRANVAVKEHNGARDMAAILTSLVQLLLDPYCRSIQGFQMLIEKEWVALGHPFRDRLGLVTQPDDEEKQCPVFLLFLDCVYQLQRLMPKSFEFSEHYLTSLWDSACSGLFQNFIFNCQHDRMFENGDTKKLSTLRNIHLLNVWDIDKQYSKMDICLFMNPAYTHGKRVKIKAVESIDGYTSGNCENRMQQSVRFLNKYSYYSQKPSDRVISLSMEENSGSTEQHICSDICWNQASFWSGCFLRWLTPIQIVSGGPPIEFVLESILAEKNKMLLKQIEELEHAVQQPDDPSERESFWSTKQGQLMNVTSSFPFLPGRPPSQMYFFTMPMKICSEEMTSSAEFQSSISSGSADYTS